MTKRILFSSVILILIFCLSYPGGAFATAQEVSQSNISAIVVNTSEVQVLESDSQGMLFELTLPELTLTQDKSDRGDCQKILLPGWGQSGEPGQPGLPVKGVLIGIPVNAHPIVTVENATEAGTKESINLCPIAKLTVNSSLSGLTQNGGESLIEDAGAYALNKDYPGTSFAEVDTTEMIRSQRVLHVQLLPVHYNPANQHLSYFRKLRVRVEFNTLVSPLAASTIDEGAYEDIFRSTLLNYDQARAWRSPSPEIGPAAVDTFLPGGLQNTYRVTVNQDGVYQITYQDLSNPGVNFTGVNPHNLRMYTGGNEISIIVTGDTDNTFDPGDTILFYGKKISSRYTDNNVYWLTWDSTTPGLRMTAADGQPGSASVPTSFRQTQRSESNNMYLSNTPNGADMDRWYWDYTYATAGNPASKTFTITLPHSSTSTAVPMIIRGLLKGYAASPQHHTRIKVNGDVYKDDYWPSTADYPFEFSLAQPAESPASLTIEVNCPADGGISTDSVLINWFEVVYARDFVADNNQSLFSMESTGPWKYQVAGFNSNSLTALDVTDPAHPVLINNATVEQVAGGTYTLTFQQDVSSARQYAAASATGLLTPASIVHAQTVDLYAGTNEADYIIITHPDFLAAVQPLADYHAIHHALRTMVVNVQDIYDEFSGGVMDPQAIHDFLAYANTHWTGLAPTYVLLAGDGTVDFKNYKRLNEATYIPPFLANVDPWIGETAADNRYVTFGSGDILPDMALGRLPGKSAAEVSAEVAKIIGYMDTTAGDWAKKITLVADKNDPGAGSFTGSSDAIANNPALADFTKEKIYSTVTHTAAEAKTATLNAFNDGRLIVHYSGHANSTTWSNDKLWDMAYLPLLTDTGRLPFVVNMTCLTGYYILPNVSSADNAVMEAMQRLPSTGAVASWAATGYGLTAGHDMLDTGLFNSIFVDHNLEVGLATMQAKYYLFTNSAGNRDLIDTFLLFGDPAMRLANPGPTALQVTSFAAVPQQPNQVLVEWTTVNDVNTNGFYLSRSNQQNGPYRRLNSNQFIPPEHAPGITQDNVYSFVDTDILPGVTYYYRLEHVDLYNDINVYGYIPFTSRYWHFIPITLKR